MRRAAGMTLVEVLVAVLVLAIGLLGIAGLQSAALSNNLMAYQYTLASSLAQAMTERMRANREGVRSGAYALDADARPAPAPVNCAASACSPVEQAQWDIAAIYAQLSSSADTANLPSSPRGVLPGSHLSIACDDGVCAADSLRIVTIYWDGSRRRPDRIDCDALHCVRLGYLP